MIGAEQLARLKKGAIAVNAARGGIIDEQALVDALHSGHLFAAGVDVFVDEPPPGHIFLHALTWASPPTWAPIPSRRRSASAPRSSPASSTPCTATSARAP